MVGDASAGDARGARSEAKRSRTQAPASLSLAIVMSILLDLPRGAVVDEHVRADFAALPAHRLVWRLARFAGMSTGSMLRAGLARPADVAERVARMVWTWALQGFPDAGRRTVVSMSAAMGAWLVRDTGGGKKSVREDHVVWHLLASCNAALGLRQLAFGSKRCYRVAARGLPEEVQRVLLRLDWNAPGWLAYVRRVYRSTWHPESVAHAAACYLVVSGHCDIWYYGKANRARTRNGATWCG